MIMILFVVKNGHTTKILIYNDHDYYINLQHIFIYLLSAYTISYKIIYVINNNQSKIHIPYNI